VRELRPESPTEKPWKVWQRKKKVVDGIIQCEHHPLSIIYKSALTAAYAAKGGWSAFKYIPMPGQQWFTETRVRENTKREDFLQLEAWIVNMEKDGDFTHLLGTLVSGQVALRIALQYALKNDKKKGLSLNWNPPPLKVEIKKFGKRVQLSDYCYLVPKIDLDSPITDWFHPVFDPLDRDREFIGGISPKILDSYVSVTLVVNGVDVYEGCVLPFRMASWIGKGQNVFTDYVEDDQKFLKAFISDMTHAHRVRRYWDVEKEGVEINDTFYQNNFLKQLGIHGKFLEIGQKEREDRDRKREMRYFDDAEYEQDYESFNLSQASSGLRLGCAGRE